MNLVMNAPPNTTYRSATPAVGKSAPANSAVYGARRGGRPALARVEGRTCMSGILARVADARNGPFGAGRSGTLRPNPTAPPGAEPRRIPPERRAPTGPSMTPVPLRPDPIRTDAPCVHRGGVVCTRTGDRKTTCTE